jgi:uncharacterized protein YjbJ (UPF0337 family)
MGDLTDVGQKIKGKYQKIKGDIQQDSGSPLSGTVEKIKGSLNEGFADTKLRSRRNTKASTGF